MRDAKLYSLTGSYLAEPHLQGKESVVEIEKVEIHEFEKRGKEKKKVKKPVLFFVGKSIPFGLTAKVNIESLITLHGRDMDAWVGKKIKLIPSTCEACGDPNKPCVRVDKAE